MEYKLNVMFTEKYDHTELTHFIPERDFCAKADTFIRQTLAGTQPVPLEIPCHCLFWKTRELPIAEIKGNNVDTTRALVIHEKGLVEFVFNSGKCHCSISQIHSIHRIERTDSSIIIVTQNAVVPCADIIIFGMYQFSFRLSIEGQKEVEELDKFLHRLKESILK